MGLRSKWRGSRGSLGQSGRGLDFFELREPSSVRHCEGSPRVLRAWKEQEVGDLVEVGREAGDGVEGLALLVHRGDALEQRAGVGVACGFLAKRSAGGGRTRPRGRHT